MHILVALPEWNRGNLKANSNFTLTFVDNHLLPDMNFNGHFLIKNNISIPKKAINRYISYTLGLQIRNLNTAFTLGNCLYWLRQRI